MKQILNNLYSFTAIFSAFIAIGLIWLIFGFGGVIIVKLIQGFYYALTELTVMFAAIFIFFGALVLWIIRVERKLRGVK